MGRGKQTRQRQQQSSKQIQDQESSSSLDHQSKQNQKEDELAQLYRVDFDEEIPVRGSTATTRSSFRELFCLLFCLVGVGTIAVVMGLGAGMAVSIQFYDGSSSDPLFQPQQPARPYKRVTGWDIDILSNNVIQKQGSDTKKVVTQTKSASYSSLSIVEETSLNGDSTRKMSENSSFDIGLSEATILPKLCSDGVTMGFDDWSTLKAAIHEANSLSAERFLKWNEYFATLDEDAFPATFEDGMLYYEEDAVFTICPGVTLKARQGPIFVNAENVVIRCVHCTIQVGGSHLSFGPHAKHVLIRGVAFTGAELSSLIFYHDGADVSFEDCSWRRNWGGRGDRGEIADMNSTSVINFYRCDIRTESPTAVRVHGIASRI